MHEFHAFSLTHWLVLGVFAFLTAVACALGIRFRGTQRLRTFERAAGVVLLGLWCTATTYWLLPANYKLEEALPIHMCDLTGLIAPLLLLTGRRFLRTLLYFWGIGLSIHGMLTPVLTDGPITLRFWLFWLTHAGIIGTAVYDLIAHAYRPSWRDCLTAIAACAVWLITVLIVNLTLDVNYGYVGNTTPERPTVIDTLGPWPQRVFMMTGAVLGLFVTMWLPFGIAARRARGPRPQAA